jgi:hypothetical protein
VIPHKYTLEVSHQSDRKLVKERIFLLEESCQDSDKNPAPTSESF